MRSVAKKHCSGRTATLARALPAAALVLAVVSALASGVALAAEPAAPLLVVDGEVKTPLRWSAADLAKLPRVTLEVPVPHGEGTARYEGVSLREILAKAGLPTGHDLRGAELTRVVVVECLDGYRVAFALAELDAGFREAAPLLADRRDGKALDAEEGPLRLVVPGELRPARWARQVKRITLTRPVS